MDNVYIKIIKKIYILNLVPGAKILGPPSSLHPIPCPVLEPSAAAFNMGDPPTLKRPKLEKADDDSTYCPRPSSNGAAPVRTPGATAAIGAAPGDDVEEEDDIAEEAVIALIAHRERDVERCKLKLLHYQSLVRPHLPFMT
jgi:hypothetical protein